MRSNGAVRGRALGRWLTRQTSVEDRDDGDADERGHAI